MFWVSLRDNVEIAGSTGSCLASSEMGMQPECGTKVWQQVLW